MPYAPGSGSFEAGPTDGTTMQQVGLPVGFLLRATWSDTRDTLGAVADTVSRPSADLQRPRGREALSARPPRSTTRPRGALIALTKGQGLPFPLGGALTRSRASLGVARRAAAMAAASRSQAAVASSR